MKPNDALSGGRCNAHPHNITDRCSRPGGQAFFDILQASQRYRTYCCGTLDIGQATAVQHIACVKAGEWLRAAAPPDVQLYRAGRAFISRLRPPCP